jgi:hypothetical protein
MNAPVAKAEAIAAPITFTTWNSATDVDSNRVKTADWPALVAALQAPGERGSKETCKMIKLATFAHGCRAIDLQGIHGIEGDYDGEQVNIEDGAARLQAMGVEAFLYTRASHEVYNPPHSYGGPRWRVVAPLSREHTAAEHTGAVALLNGALGGILAPEGFEANRRYFYGKVKGVKYDTRTTTGARVDTLDLFIEPIGKPTIAGKASTAPAEADDLGRMATVQRATAETIADLKSALAGMKAKRADERGAWVDVLQALASLKETDFGADALQLACEFSERSDKFDLDDLGRVWESLKPTSRTYLSIFEWAKADGWINPRAGVPAPQLATVESVTAAATAPRRFPRLAMTDYINRKPPAWRVKGLLPNDGVALIYGATRSGKSFFCIDLAMAIAKGEDWRGLKTKQGAVVYVCAEGENDFQTRVRAYAMHRGDGPLDVIAAAPNLLIKADVEALIVELMLSPVAVLFLDTLACMTVGGDENSAKDMVILMDHCKLIGRMTGALVALVHHTGKSGEGPRGSSVILDAVDVSIAISRAGDDRIAKVAKSKGGPDGQEYGFKLQTVAAGEDEDGEEISSCVVEHVQAVPKAERKQDVKGTNEAVVLCTLQDLIDLDDTGVFAANLIAAAAERLIRTDAKDDKRRYTCSRAIDSLKVKNCIVEKDGRLFPA